MDSVNLNSGLSVIIPVYNEAEIIENTARDFYEKIIKKISGTKFIIVEDGSTDGTREILHLLNNEIPFKLISSQKRKGYTEAFKDALRLAKTDLVFFSDSDGQHEPSDFFKLLKEMPDYDIVSGYKSPRRDPVHRIVISKVFNFLICLLFGFKVHDINSGFKLIKKSVIDNVLDKVTCFKHCAMSEFILRAYLAGYKIKEVPVSHYPRTSGKTNIFKAANLPFIIFELIKNLFNIKFCNLDTKIK